jgi:UDP-N-acetyl-D-glucosamine/UDP-N-acetyl-D-galactosamine dehydrogenase
VLGLAERCQPVVGTRVLVLGLTFKENCPDLRNTKVVDLIEGLERYGMEVQVVDPWVDPEEALREYGLSVLSEIPTGHGWSAVVAAVAHQQFAELKADQWRQLLTASCVLLDLKGIVPRELGALRL